MTSDEFSGIFDHLDPEDFSTPDLSAQQIPISDTYSFDQFIADQMTMLRYAFAAADGDVNPLTILVTAGTAVVYQATDEETLGEYISRMSAESHRLNAKWVFFYKKTLIAMPDVSDDVNVDSNDLMAAAINSGTAWEAIYWYAARKDGGDPNMRHGYITIDGTKLTEATEAPSQANALLEAILGGA